MAIVTDASHPVTFKCFQMITTDCGGSAPSSFDVPEPWASKLDIAEKGLTALSEDELETFCVGEFNEMQAILERADSVAVLEAHHLLGAFFDDFSREENED